MDFIGSYPVAGLQDGVNCCLTNVGFLSLFFVVWCVSIVLQRWRHFFFGSRRKQRSCTCWTAWRISCFSWLSALLWVYVLKTSRTAVTPPANTASLSTWSSPGSCRSCRRCCCLYTWYSHRPPPKPLCFQTSCSSPCSCVTTSRGNSFISSLICVDLKKEKNYFLYSSVTA